MIIGSLRGEFLRYRILAEQAIDQLDDEQLWWQEGPGTNSVGILVQHLAGNLRSRFTEFLTTDGEKPWRKRDEEFIAGDSDREALAKNWEEGWTCLLDTLDLLTVSDLDHTVTIRGVELFVDDALHRSLTHVAYHVGQIVLIARALRGDEWQFLSIPPGASDSYNENPDLEKPPE